MFLYLDRENDCFDFLHFWMRNRASKAIDEVQGKTVAENWDRKRHLLALSWPI